MNWIKIILVNFFVFIGLILLSEIGLRILWTGYKCISYTCDFSKVSNLAINKLNNGFTEKNIGLSEPNSILGYIPKSGFEKVINAAGWNNKFVSIDNNGYRSNGYKGNDENLNIDKKILAVGDSFTFGDQVNDHETWPACVEKNTNRLTLNAGVFGYGSAQAVRRAWLITQSTEVDTIILSIFLNRDFHRDQLKFRSGYPRPAVVLRNGVTSFAEIPSLDSIGTKWNPKETNTLIVFINNYSYLFSTIFRVFDFDITGMRRTEIHPEAASIDKIVEFTISEFSKLRSINKFVLFQYSQTDIQKNSDEVKRIKNLVNTIASKKNIHTLDTFEKLSVANLNKEQPIWEGHHTAYGNLLVCREIVQFISSLDK